LRHTVYWWENLLIFVQDDNVELVHSSTMKVSSPKKKTMKISCISELLNKSVRLIRECIVINLWHKCNHTFTYYRIEFFWNQCPMDCGHNICSKNIFPLNYIMLYREGYSYAKGVSPNQVSSQNLVPGSSVRHQSWKSVVK
jgi:hypothetical protein